MKKKANKRILFTGANGFPFGSAVIQRQAQLANALVDADYNVTVINTRGHHNKNIAKRENIKLYGNYNGITYIYCSLLPYRPDNFYLRNLVKYIGLINQFFIILYFSFFKNTCCIFNNSIALKPLKYYHFLAKICNLQLIYDYVEMISSLGNRDKNDFNEIKKSFDHEFHKYTDKVIVISNFLEKQVDKIAPEKLKIKIPPIIDFSYFDSINPKSDVNPFVLFCGSAAYEDVITFIIDFYIKSIAIKNNYKLMLVLNGNKEEVDTINKYIVEHNGNDNIKIKSNLSYYDLVCLYKSSKAQLIPIGNNMQDQARFPFKICEYTASKRPIITSNAGSIREYFNKNKNAFIADIDDIEDFANKINSIIKEPELADEIGLNGYNLGKKVFNYKSYSESLNKLINYK